MRIMFVAEINRLPSFAVLLLLGSAGLYVASRAAVDALARSGGNPGGAGRLPSPGLLALGHWVPVAAIAGLATARGLPHVALGIVFGSSVAAVSLAMGLVTYLATPTVLPASRRSWPLLLPGVMVPFLGGFTSQLTLLHAGVLILLGSIAWSIWRGSQAEPSSADALAAAFAGIGAEATSQHLAARPGVPVVLRAIQWLLAVAIAVLGARMILMGTVATEAQIRFFSTGLLAAAVLSPVIVLPMIASGTDLAHHGRPGDAVAALVGLAMLNLFALLPMVIIFWYFRSATQIGLKPGLAGLWSQLEPIPLPISVWRIDLVVLTIINFAMIPVALGRWALGRLESLGLILGYVAYLVACVYVASLHVGG